MAQARAVTCHRKALCQLSSLPWVSRQGKRKVSCLETDRRERLLAALGFNRLVTCHKRLIHQQEKHASTTVDQS